MLGCFAVTSLSGQRWWLRGPWWFMARVLFLALPLSGVPSLSEALITIGALDTPDLVYDVEVVGGLAYVADGYAGLRVIDVSHPAAPVEVDAPQPQ